MEGLLSTGPTPSSLVTTCNKPSPSIWSCFMSYASTSRFHDWLVSFSTHSSACYCVKSSSILNKIAPNIGPSKGAWILFWKTFQYVWIEPNLMVECVAFYQMDRLFDCIIKPATGIFVLFVWKWKNKNTQQYNLQIRHKKYCPIGYVCTSGSGYPPGFWNIVVKYCVPHIATLSG